MSFYKFAQLKGGDEHWSLLLADHEAQFIETEQPAFTTILAADNNFSGEMTQDDILKVKYAGDFYTDFDADSLEEVIPQFQAFLTKLKTEYNFDLTQAKLYASGGKGFHCIIPLQAFTEKVNPKGYLYLPAIFKEIAMEMVVDTLDMRVYTARRGRMFRTANVERPDKPGVYKVPITLKQALEMTPELYRDLCSRPRPQPTPTPPTLNMKLALAFTSASDKADKAVKGRKPNPANLALAAKFKGSVPPSIMDIMAGKHLKPDVGFQKIATQLALAAVALEMTEPTFLGLTDGLCETHESDGTRYNTKAKRRNELSRMYHYMYDNPCYVFSIGGVKSLMETGTPTPDLDAGGGDLVDESDVTDEDRANQFNPDYEPTIDDLSPSITMGMTIGKNGIWRKTDEGSVKISSAGMADIKQLVDLQTTDINGYEVSVFANGQLKGKYNISMDTFLSRQKFMAFTLRAVGGSMAATDQQIGGLADIMRFKANKSGKTVYTTIREGLDVVQLPDGSVDCIWADGKAIHSNKNLEYRLVGGMTTRGAEYGTDLSSAPMLVDTPETRLFFDNLLQINQPDVIGKYLGWFLACFFSQSLRFKFNQFPMLQVYGQAGSGKTATAVLLSQLHYFRRPVKLASATHTTGFSLGALVTGSASIPLILDEMKPREMNKSAVDNVKMVLKENYAGTEYNRGRVSQGTGQSVLANLGYKNVAPIAYLGEGLDAQSALMERAVIVNMSKEMKRGLRENFIYAQQHKEVLSTFGRTCLDKALDLDLTKLETMMIDAMQLVADQMGQGSMDDDRPIFNAAVVLTGLEFGRQILHEVFKGRYNAQIAEFKRVLLDYEGKQVKVDSEITKVLNTMVHLSTIVDQFENNRLRVGHEYFINVNGDLELEVRGAFDKYVRYQRGQGGEILYDSVEAFTAALMMYPPLIDKHSPKSALKRTTSLKVFTFKADLLREDGVDEFYDK